MSRQPVRVGKILHVSRQELMTLLYDKLEMIRATVEEVQDEGEERYAGPSITDLKKRLTRIAVEAKRSQALIDDYEAHWMVGTCMYCGRPFSEHSEHGTPQAPLPGDVRVRPKTDSDENAQRPPHCRGRCDKYESLELATYQNLPESAGEG